MCRSTPGARARVEALEVALDEARGRAGVERLYTVSGVMGTLLDLVEVNDDLVLAFEAAVEAVLDAVLVQGGASARAAVERLRASGSGGNIVPLAPADDEPGAPRTLPARRRRCGTPCGPPTPPCPSSSTD